MWEFALRGITGPALQTKGVVLKVSFDAAMAEEWTNRALAHAVYGGADFRECATTANMEASGTSCKVVCEKSYRAS